ncbi:uncharacterized protein LTR77_002008 [Saxophila tyrrhenica]|uniref:Nitronate monooxygenase domain-containing protein n=1 Tax=Saxophila tyrrhenica TaxID=1690608 RepID=A0AAV9PHS0_9PEZI|nr:hypothetical protein LTR77_002008 [Saxophila tyrrhenica]
MPPKSLPWTKSPLIVNAPMGGFAGPELAIAVTKAGGLGQIGAVTDMQALDHGLSKVAQELDRIDGLLPIGVGFLPFVTDMDQAIPVLEKHRPAVVWLFAASEFEHYATLATRVRRALPTTQIWIQVGSVAAALQVAETAKPDVLCVQGSDAGGHGFQKGAGIISLLPEVVDALAAHGHDIDVVAAGGIADGRGVAAALSLGARRGVVVGTRFLAAEETQVHPAYQKAVLASQDGGQSTIRSKLFDNLRGPNIWPVAYDGRSLISESFDDHERGTEMEEIRRKHQAALQQTNGGFGESGRKGYAAIWAGTAVGLVTKVQPAKKIVEGLQAEAKEVLLKASARL